jgi:hypothetical protein
MIVMKLTIELEIGLSFLLSLLCHELVTDRETKTHRRGRSKRSYGHCQRRTEIREAEPPGTPPACGRLSRRPRLRMSHRTRPVMCRGDRASTGTPAAPALAAEAAVPRSFAPLSLRTMSRSAGRDCSSRTTEAVSGASLRGAPAAPHQTRQRPDLLLKPLLRAFYPLYRSRADASTWPCAPWSWRSTCHPRTPSAPGGRPRRPPRMDRRMSSTPRGVLNASDGQSVTKA